MLPKACTQKRFLFSLLFAMLALTGCTLNPTTPNNAPLEGADGPVTLTGEAQQTKDGYYIQGYLLPDAAIAEINPEHRPGMYHEQILEVQAATAERIDPCASETDEIVQCREEPYTVLTNLQQLRVQE